jgi:hypothetical protein
MNRMSIGSAGARVRLGAIGKTGELCRCRRGGRLPVTWSEVRIQCSFVVEPCGRYWQRFHQGMERRRDGKANVALAQFLGVVYHTFGNNWVFEGFPNFAMAS